MKCQLLNTTSTLENFLSAAQFRIGGISLPSSLDMTIDETQAVVDNILRFHIVKVNVSI